MAVLKSPGPVTIADFSKLGQNLLAEMSKADYTHQQPYATTFSCNLEQAIALDNLNLLLDSYYNNILSDKSLVINAFNRAKIIVNGQGQAPHFKKMLLQMEQDYISSSCRARIIPITTMMKSGAQGAITAREEKDNIARVKYAAEKYNFHVLSDNLGNPAIPESRVGFGVAASGFKDKKYDGYWVNRVLANNWLRKLMKHQAVPLSNSNPDPIFDEDYKPDDYDEYKNIYEITITNGKQNKVDKFFIKVAVLSFLVAASFSSLLFLILPVIQAAVFTVAVTVLSAVLSISFSIFYRSYANKVNKDDTAVLGNSKATDDKDISKAASDVSAGHGLEKSKGTGYLYDIQKFKHAKPNHWKILAFYNDYFKHKHASLVGENIESLQWIKKATEDEMEGNHSFVQLAFPIKTVSSYSHVDTYVTDSNFDEIKQCLQAIDKSTGRARIDVAMEAMLNHWGLKWSGEEGRIKVVDDLKLKKYLITHSNHNQLRFTRFLQSVNAFHPQGFKIVKAAYSFIVSHSDYMEINSETRGFWADCYNQIVQESIRIKSLYK